MSGLSEKPGPRGSRNFGQLITVQFEWSGDPFSYHGQIDDEIDFVLIVLIFYSIYHFEFSKNSDLLS